MKIRYLFIFFLITLQISGFCQADDTTFNTEGYYTITFNSLSLSITDESYKPRQGDQYKIIFTRYPGQLTTNNISRYVEGENYSLVSKDTLMKYNISDLSTLSVTFLKTDKSCWIKASVIESKQKGDTLYVSSIKLSPLRVNYDKKQACENDPLPVSPVISDNLLSVEFSSPDGLNINRYSGVILPAGQPAGKYLINYASAYCLDKISDTFTVMPKPTFTIEKNRKLCEGISMELVPETASDYSYYWSTGALSESITVSAPGKYSLTAENEFGCLQKDTVYVEVKSIRLEQIDYEIAEADCYNTGSINVHQLNIANGKMPYKYRFLNTINGQIVNDASNLREGDYQLTIEDADGCITTYQKTFAIRKNCLNDYPVFSPNTDGMDDDYYIPYEGEAVVYDRNGIVRHRFMAPDYWNGKDSDGKPLPMGAYVIIVGKKEIINITIIK